ncbi:hypothetical protein B6U81_01095 [Thermoplasmatales archaeon ex4484_30]|nr:MAG: hypothetical protein B6U81_01095 [Thermoplasmatales archaeon ex4484_30]
MEERAWNYDFPKLSDYIMEKFPAIGKKAKCHNRIAGRLLHIKAWKYVKGGDDSFDFEEVKNYIKRKCPEATDEEVERRALQVALQFYQFKRWASKVDGLQVAQRKLVKIGDATIFVKPDFITPRAVYEVRFFYPHFPIPKKMPEVWERCVVFAIAYFPKKVYVVFITTERYTIRRINPTIDEVERIKQSLNDFFWNWKNFAENRSL